MPSAEVLKMRIELSTMVAKLHETIGGPATLEVLQHEAKLIQFSERTATTKKPAAKEGK